MCYTEGVDDPARKPRRVSVDIPPTLIRSKAPLRISFSGGGTDVSPYMDEYGGVVLSTTIDKYAYATLRVRDGKDITIQSLDYDVVAKYRTDEPLIYDGNLDLVKAVINRFNGPLASEGTGAHAHSLDFFLHSDAPPGSGLGSSSTVVVTLIGLFYRWLHLPLTHYDIAQLAYEIERVDLGIQGGMQDQYAAVFGGFNFIEFGKSAVVVNPLRVEREILHELNYNLLLCYTGQTRLSARILETQIEAYRHKRADVLGAMHQIKEVTVAMKNALLQGKLDDFGALLHEAWEQKKKLARQITDPHIDEMYDVARQNGALGGKILGAGGGGYMLLYCPFDRKHIIARKMEELGGQVVEFDFDHGGLQTWTARSDCTWSV
jgi:D-glycero-alpha-D-manno-heptose-7-phosphate kinase